MQIKFKLNSTEVSEGNLQAAIEEAALAKTKEQLTAKLASVRCPEHNQVPQLEFEGTSLKSMKVRIKACCETARGFAVAAMNTK